MTTRARWILGGLVAVAALVAVALTLPDPTIDVETAAVARATITVTVDDEGRTRVRDRYVVAAPVGGRLARIAINEGDRVADGDLLARIYPTPADPRAVEVARGQLAAAEARRLEAAAQVENARAYEEQTGRDLERVGKLTEAGALSQDAIEQARLAATSAGRQLEVRRAALRAARRRSRRPAPPSSA